MKDSVLYYSVGPLLYCPANHTGIADSLIQERFGVHYSLALCLEDTISDHHVEAAEQQLVATVKALQAASEKKTFFPSRNLCKSTESAADRKTAPPSGE